MGFTDKLKLSQSNIRLMIKFDEFSKISIKSRLTIERLNHIVVIPKGSDFSILLGLLGFDTSRFGLYYAHNEVHNEK